MTDLVAEREHGAEMMHAIPPGAHFAVNTLVVDSKCSAAWSFRFKERGA
ncbi:hypothetical protein [Sphingobium cloacae]|nr:hypothetical protein [Sphingobium cloacae]